MIWLEMVWLNRRKSVMRNGRWSAESTGTGSRKSLRSGLVWVRALPAMVVLLLVGSVLVGSGSRRHAAGPLAPIPASPIPASTRSSLHSKPDARALLGQLPLIFEPNQGQADPQVKFLARGAGYGLFLDATSAVLAMPTAHSTSPGQ